jgi:hypothetical protein
VSQKPVSSRVGIVGLLLGFAAILGGHECGPGAIAWSQSEVGGIHRSQATTQGLQYRLTEADERLLEEIQFACFQYFWREVGAPVPLVKDRHLGPVSSIAAVGFQLSSLPIGVERGWVTRAEAEERAVAILSGLLERQDNKYRGVYLHFPDLNTGGLSTAGYEMVASTVDHALLMAGSLPAAVYFGGRTAQLVDRLIAETQWNEFAVAPGGLLSMGWRPEDPRQVAGRGSFLTYHWKDSGDEERLIYFLAVGAPDPARGVPPQRYYETQRPIQAWQQGEPFVVTYPGALFTYFFSHCWIDYQRFAADAPEQFGSPQPRVDWFENSRRAIDTQRLRAAAMSATYPNLAADRWGLSACDGPQGYMVPNIRPNLADRDDWHQGTIAPYAAGSAIMMMPEKSLQALRAFRNLKSAEGEPLVWRDVAQGGYGFADAFNVELNWASPDYLGIDQGPLLLAIENVRSGLIWNLTKQHSLFQRAVDRLGWVPYP